MELYRLYNNINIESPMREQVGHEQHLWVCLQNSYDLVINTFLEAFGVMVGAVLIFIFLLPYPFNSRRPCPATPTWRSCSKGLRDSSHTNCWQTILKKYSECCTIGNHQGVGANTIPDWPKESKNLTANKCTAIEVEESGAGNKLKSSLSLSQITLMQRGNLPPKKHKARKNLS